MYLGHLTCSVSYLLNPEQTLTSCQLQERRLLAEVVVGSPACQLPFESAELQEVRNTVQQHVHHAGSHDTALQPLHTTVATEAAQQCEQYDQHLHETPSLETMQHPYRIITTDGLIITRISEDMYEYRFQNLGLSSNELEHTEVNHVSIM